MNFKQFIEKFVDNEEHKKLSINEYNHNITAYAGNTKKRIITKEFKDIISNVSKGSSQFHFVSGVAGTGKSTLINEIRKKNKNILVVAPTGISALNVSGSTIHSAFNLPPTLFPEVTFKNYKAPLFELMDLLIIDEISMVKADVLDAISDTLKLHRKKNKPFGGVNVAVFGDLFQLSPVLQEQDKTIFNEEYSTPYFFGAKCLASITPTLFELTQTFRQLDTEFVELLNNIRLGKNLIETINIINKKCYTGTLKSDLTLTSRSQAAEEINLDKLAKLNTKEYTYFASYTGDYFTDKDNKSLPSPKELNLKVGAKVIFTKNKRDIYQNGSRGIVKELNKDKIVIKTEKNTLVDLDKATWEWFRYQIVKQDKEKNIKKEVVATYTQYPIKLGWAMTIHKSQGLTLNSCNIDFGKSGAFVPGQLYVALSRCKSMNAISLKNKLSISDVIIDRAVSDFYRYFFNPNAIENDNE